MEAEKQFNDLMVKLAESAVKNVASSITTKIASFKKQRNDAKTIQFMEETINELLTERQQLIGIAQAFEQELLSRKISDADIQYITDTLVPLLEDIVSKTDNEQEKQKNQEYLDLFKKVLSKEVVTVAQLLGFNFKQAIGEPLTELARKKILSNSPSDDLRKLSLENSNLTMQISQDEEATKRFLKLVGRE